MSRSIWWLFFSCALKTNEVGFSKSRGTIHEFYLKKLLNMVMVQNIEVMLGKQ
jgi:hypothetical protein